MRLHVAYLAFALAACGDDGGHNLPDAPSAAHIVVTPADVQVTVINGQAVTQAYTAHAIDAAGADTDITADATFSVADAGYGTFTGASLSVSGQGAGPTRVVATWGAVQGDTGLTVFVQQRVTDPNAPTGAADLFDAATEDPSIAPTIVYPSDHILVPPNLGQFDVHWNNNAANTDNLFEVKMKNQYVDIRLYTLGIDAIDANIKFWTLYQPSQWSPIASTGETVSLAVAGMNTAAPATKGTAAAQSVDVTNENAQGGIYYWTTSPTQGIYRYDVATPDVAPSSFFPAGTQPTGCVGCHSLSRDGSKIGLTLDSATGRGSVWDVATVTPLFPIAGATPPPYWDFVAFNTPATKIVSVESGHMRLRQTDATLLMQDEVPPVVVGNYGTQPEFSPDNQRMVNVEYLSGGDYDMNDGSIVIRSWDENTNTFGPPMVLVQGTAGAQNYYPSFSPDGTWIVFTRTSGYSYNDPSAETWVVKADGSAPPVLFGTANITGNITNSWARWVPFGQTYGASNQPMFYLTFSSQRAFGVRIPGGGRPQIWMTPFFPEKATAGQDPSGNAFRLPFQSIDSSNHIAQWTQAIVVQ